MPTKKNPKFKCLALYSKDHESYYPKIYSPAIKKVNGEPVSVAKIITTASRIEKVTETITGVHFVLADVSDRDRDVLFRAGLAHAIGTPVGIIAQSAEDIPSDLQHVGYAVYDTRKVGWEATLKKDIADLISEGLDSGQ